MRQFYFTVASQISLITEESLECQLICQRYMTISEFLIGYLDTYMYEDKFEFRNQRCQPTVLAAPHLVPKRVNLSVNRALLTV